MLHSPLEKNPISKEVNLSWFCNYMAREYSAGVGRPGYISNPAVQVEGQQGLPTKLKYDKPIVFDFSIELYKFRFS